MEEELGGKLEYAQHLDSIFNDFDVTMQQEHPLKMNGFHPAFVWHFIEFIEEQKKMIETTDKK